VLTILKLQTCIYAHAAKHTKVDGVHSSGSEDTAQHYGH